MEALSRVRLYLQNLAFSLNREMKFISSCASKNKKIVVHGAYDSGNVGDRVIGWTLYIFLSKYLSLPTHLIGVPSHRTYLPSNKLWYPAYKSKLFVVGGGGVIPHHLPQIARGILSSQRSMVIGVGCRETTFFKYEHKKLIKCLNICEYISVRDKYSQHILSSLLNREIHKTACPSFLLYFIRSTLKLKKKRDCKEKLKIGIALYSLDQLAKEFEVRKSSWKKEFLTYIKNELKRLSKDANIYFIPFAPEDEEFARKYLNTVIPVGNIFPLADPIITLRRVDNMDYMICMRFHSLVFSLITETPFYAISYDSKMSAFLEEIGVKNYSKLNLCGDPVKLQLHDIDFTPHTYTLKQRVRKLAMLALKDVHKILEVYRLVDDS